MQPFFLPVNQFDLVEPRILSGVVTQGRGGGAEEWVETFIVRYSPDGKTWTTLMDEDGSNKVSEVKILTDETQQKRPWEAMDWGTTLTRNEGS